MAFLLTLVLLCYQLVQDILSFRRNCQEFCARSSLPLVRNVGERAARHGRCGRDGGFGSCALRLPQELRSAQIKEDNGAEFVYFLQVRAASGEGVDKRLFGTGVTIAVYGTDRHSRMLLAGNPGYSVPWSGQKHAGRRWRVFFGTLRD